MESVLSCKAVASVERVLKKVDSEHQFLLLQHEGKQKQGERPDQHSWHLKSDTATINSLKARSSNLVI